MRACDQVNALIAMTLKKLSPKAQTTKRMTTTFSEALKAPNQLITVLLSLESSLNTDVGIGCCNSALKDALLVAVIAIAAGQSHSTEAAFVVALVVIVLCGAYYSTCPVPFAFFSNITLSCGAGTCLSQ
jgi:hypothetical protein